MWIAVATAAYVLYALVGITDRFVVTKGIKEPVAYVFFIGIFSGLAVFLIPFVTTWPDAFMSGIALLAGLVFIWGLIPLMTALKKGEASTVFPAVGGLTTIFTFIFAALLLGETLGVMSLIAFSLLLLGYVLVSLTGGIKRIALDILDPRIISASVMIAASLVLRRIAFIDGPFFSAWLIVAFGMALGAVLILFVPSGLKRIRQSFTGSKPPKVWVIVLNQIGGAIAAFLQNYAISLGAVALVQAMQSIQYALIFLFALILSRWFPCILKESFNRDAVVRKIGGTVVIAAGLAVLFIV